MMDSKMIIAILALLLKHQREKRVRMVFWDCQETVHEPPNGLSHSPRETIIYGLYRQIIRQFVYLLNLT